jgi:endonuclease YncB( thermonuclease family)
MGQCKSLLKQIEGDKILDLLLNEKPAAVTASNGSYKKDSISAVYPALPSKYKSVHCVKVYDGDTLTLDSGDRVRLIGIDAPEIKENQPYAQEAKMFVSSLCQKKDVYISFEPGQDETDRFCRSVAWVWVKQDDGFLNVNEAMIANGLASVYFYGKSRLQNAEKMIALQKSARDGGKGKWSNFINTTVFKTKNGSAYHHSRNCSHLARSGNLQTIKASDGLDLGLSACRACAL